MCGISGFNWKDEEQIRVMSDAISYRGPDARGFFIDGNISLGHNRLSVIDLSAEANQPMFDDKKELVIVFNGEIYNFQELKKELESEYEFKTKSDTEVILAGYRKWGKGVVKKLNGMFALAIWDKRDQSLFCARDHAGIKPFYYYWDDKRFIFASEIPAILTHNIPRVLNQEALNHYFRVLYVPEPMTLFKNIYKLPPAHTLIIKDGVMSIEGYDQASDERTDLSYVEAVPALRKSVVEAVGRQMVSDVPIGVYLSGGIDSSSVLFSMTQFSSNLDAFSMGFTLKEGEEAEKFNRDLELAKKTAKFFGARHHSFMVSPQDIREHFEESVAHNSDPVSHPTSVAMFLFAKFVRGNVTVALTGNGGDELFGGYDRYKIALAAHYYKKLPSLLRKLGNLHSQVAKLDYKDISDLFAQFMFEKDHKLSRIMAPSIFAPDSYTKDYFRDRYLSSSGEDLAASFMLADQQSWLPDYFFTLSDKMSMAHGLEERVPLMDRELVAFSRTIPRHYKVDLFNTKKILKDAFRNDLPSFLFQEPKRGWFSPGAKWLRDPDFSRFAKEVLSPGYYEETRSLFNWAEVQLMLDRHITKEEYNLTALWALLTFQTWAKHYKIKI